MPLDIKTAFANGGTLTFVQRGVERVSCEHPGEAFAYKKQYNHKSFMLSGEQLL